MVEQFYFSSRAVMHHLFGFQKQNRAGNCRIQEDSRLSIAFNLLVFWACFVILGLGLCLLQGIFICEVLGNVHCNGFHAPCPQSETNGDQ